MHKLDGPIRVIGFDADDTLWLNEVHFRNTEDQFVAMMQPWLTEREASKALFRNEMNTLELYGYGVKSFTLAMITTAIEVSNAEVGNDIIQRIIDLGKAMLGAPLELLDHVPEVLAQLQGDYRLIVATKGDLLDQERKLKNSELEPYFHHVEIMSDKTPGAYQKLVRHLDIQPQEFVMIGNSLRSDVIPVLEMGAQAIHIPYHTTWAHEDVSADESTSPYLTLSSFRELTSVFQDLEKLHSDPD